MIYFGCEKYIRTKTARKKREHTLKYKCIINVNIQLYLLFYIKYIRSNSLTHKIYWFRKLRTWLLFCRDMQTFLTLRLFSFPQQATRDHVYVGQVFFQQKQPSQCHQQYRPRKDLVSCRSDTCIQSLDVQADL